MGPESDFHDWWLLLLMTGVVFGTSEVNFHYSTRVQRPKWQKRTNLGSEKVNLKAFESLNRCLVILEMQSIVSMTRKQSRPFKKRDFESFESFASLENWFENTLLNGTRVQNDSKTFDKQFPYKSTTSSVKWSYSWLFKWVLTCANVSFVGFSFGIRFFLFRLDAEIRYWATGATYSYLSGHPKSRRVQRHQNLNVKVLVIRSSIS
jgi:hypothetical protein